MNRDFYTTLAQVLPVLLLALMFDSGYLERLRTEKRDDVLFWKKPRVRAYILFVVLLTVGSTALALFVLAGMLTDTLGLRIALVASAAIVLATLLTRVGIDVIKATSEKP